MKIAATERKRDTVSGNMARFLSVVMSACMFVTGCGSRVTPGEAAQVESAPETLGLAPVFDYELPVERPRIQVDQKGYLPGSKKIAVFQGKQLPETFRLLEKDTGRCVYEGPIRGRGEDSETGLLLGL